jgi:hypothetical protein
MRIARETGDPEILLQAHHCAWPTHFHSGRFKASVDHIDAGALIYDEVRHAHHRHLYLAHDPGVCMQYFKGPAHVLLGHPDQGLRSAEDGVALARRLGYPLSLAIALWGHCRVVARRGDAAAILCSARELVSQTDAYGLPMQRAAGLVFLGWGLCGSGNAEEGLARQREGLDLMTGLDGQLYLTLLNSQLADSLLAAGRYSDGLAVVAQAFDTLVRTCPGSTGFEANCWCMPMALPTKRARESCARRLPWRGSRMPKAGNSAPPPASSGCGVSGDGGRKRTIFSHRFTAGSPKVSIRPI